MKVLFEGKKVGEILTNCSMTSEEILCIIFGLTEFDNQAELEALYRQEDFVALDDIYFLDVNDFEFIH